MDLAIGDRVLTGPEARALLTFLDGTTVTVEPESEVRIAAAEVTDSGSSVSIQILAGTVWGRVSGLFDRGSTVTLESNTATGVVKDGLTGAQQNPDGSFVCWVRGAEMLVTGKQGQPPLLLQSDQATTVQPGATPAPRAFAVNQSVLRVSTGTGVLPLVLMPDRARVAGFVSPGIEVNQVFGSFTGETGDARVVELPAGQPGPYTLVLEGRGDGPFQVTVAGLFQGNEVYRQTHTGPLRRGERLATQVSQQLDPGAGGDPRTARVQAGSVNPLQTWDAPLPGKLILSPLEQSRAAADEQDGSAAPER
jgi:hypothetical protein